MPKTLPTFAIVLLAVSTASAEVRITGDAQVKPGGFALLRLTGADAAIWDVSPEPIQAEEVAGSFVFTAAPGTYTVRAIIVNFEAKKIERVKFVVVFLGGPGPAPPTPPGPTPPTPTPISPFAKRLQDAAIADGWQPSNLRPVADAVLKAAAAFRSGQTAQKVHDQCKEYLATCPPLKKNLAAILDEQVTATLSELRDPATVLDETTAKRLGDMFRTLAAALSEASK